MAAAPATYTDFSTPRSAPGSAASAAAQQQTDMATYSRLPAATPAPATPTPAPLTPAAPAPAAPVITPTQPVAPASSSFNEGNERNNEIASRESEFSALDQEYNARIAAVTDADSKAGAKDMARANTISALTGMVGGVDATTRAGQVDAKTKSQIQRDTDALNSEKSNRLAGIYTSIDANVQTAKNAANAKDATDRANLVNQMNTSAQNNLMKFASEGIPWDKAYQDPDFQAEVGRTGKSAFEMQTLYNGSLPKNMQPTTIFSGFKGNDFVQIMQNADGSVTNHTYNAAQLGIPKTVADLGTVTLGSSVYWYDKNAPVKADGTPNLTKIGPKPTTAAATKDASAPGPSKADVGSALTWMRAQPDYDKSMESTFNSDPVIQAKVIEAWKASNKSKSSTDNSDPFAQ